MATVQRTVNAAIALASVSGLTFTRPTPYSPPPVTDTIGSASAHTSGLTGYIRGYAITASDSGILQTIGINLYAAAGNVRIAIYSTYSGGVFSGLLADSGSLAAVSGFHDYAMPPVTITVGVVYYVCLQFDDTGSDIYYIASGVSRAVSFSYGAFPDPTGYLDTYYNTVNIRMTYQAATLPAGTWTYRNATAGERLYAGPIGIMITSSGVNYILRLCGFQNIGLATQRSGYAQVSRTITGVVMKLATSVSYVHQIPRTIASFGISLSSSASRLLTRNRTAVARILLIAKASSYRSVARTLTVGIGLAATAIPNYIFKRTATSNITLAASASRNADKYRTVIAAMALNAQPRNFIRKAKATLRILLRMEP